MSNKYLIEITISGEIGKRENAKNEISGEDDKIKEKENSTSIYFIGVEPPIFELENVSKKYPALEFELRYRDEYLDEEGKILLIQNGEIKEERADKPPIIN